MSTVLVIPAALRDKTRREFARYARDWRVRLPTLVSYEELGRPDRDDLLFRLAPRILMLDEAHNLRNTDSARTRRVDRYVRAVRETEAYFGEKLVVAALSGTLMTENILDYQHIAVWCLGDRAPVPVQRADAERWAAALDRDLGVLHRIGAGALETIPGGYHDWFRGSRGVVPTPGSDCDAAIQVSIWKPETPPALERIISAVAASSMRPDEELLDEWELPECLSQLALGFYYVWDPLPPDWWLRPRRAWRRYVRDVLDAHLDGFDSESQIVAALDRSGPSHAPGSIPPDPIAGRAALAEWRAVRDAFEPNPVPRWIDASVLAQAAEHARKPGTLVWVRFRAAGEMLEMLGIPYYGGGVEPPDQGGRPMALSIQAHGTGRNLQDWWRSLYLTIPANADAHEQGIGRTHRAGQRHDPVEVSYIGSIDYHHATLAKVLAQAKAITAASGFTHKLCLADFV